MLYISRTFNLLRIKIKKVLGKENVKNDLNRYVSVRATREVFIFHLKRYLILACGNSLQVSVATPTNSLYDI